jgi:hypothetical protein
LYRGCNGVRLTVDQRGETILVRDCDHAVIANGDQLVIYGCDTSIPAGSALTIDGNQATEGSVVHVSDQRRPDAGGEAV